MRLSLTSFGSMGNKRTDTNELKMNEYMEGSAFASRTYQYKEEEENRWVEGLIGRESLNIRLELDILK